MPVSRSRTASFKRNRHINFRALVALELLVSLMSRFGACTARISGDRHTDTQNDYRNPRCACAPRVNKGVETSTPGKVHVEGSPLWSLPVAPHLQY